MKFFMVLAVFFSASGFQAFGYDNIEETKKLSEFLMKARSTPHGHTLDLDEEDISVEDSDDSQTRMNLKPTSIRIIRSQENIVVRDNASSSEDSPEPQEDEPQD